MGNRFDLHFKLLNIEEQREIGKLFQLGNPTTGVKGLQCLINQWVKCFLTPRGTDPTALSYGTEFSRLIGRNIPLDDVRDICMIAISDCNAQLTRMHTSNVKLTTSERLHSARMIRFEQDDANAGFYLYVEIKNLASERLVLQIPGAS